ncbi:MAG TPA: hypothetical protein VF911_07220, partial [Thermoanaerobaculia bacterium]
MTRWAVALFLLLSVQARGGASVAPAVSAAAGQFVATLQADSFNAFDPMRAGGDLAAWRDVQTAMQRFRCIVVAGATIRNVREDAGRVIVELDVIGSGTMRGAPARLAAIPLQWTLTRDLSGAAPRFLSAETRETIVVRELLAALPRRPDTATVLARGVNLPQLARQFAYE